MKHFIPTELVAMVGTGGALGWASQFLANPAVSPLVAPLLGMVGTVLAALGLRLYRKITGDTVAPETREAIQHEFNLALTKVAEGLAAKAKASTSVPPGP